MCPIPHSDTKRWRSQKCFIRTIISKSKMGYLIIKCIEMCNFVGSTDGAENGTLGSHFISLRCAVRYL